MSKHETLPAGPMTAEAFFYTPEEDARTELVRGWIMREPLAGFLHGDIGSRILTLLRAHAIEHGLGTVVGPDTGFILSRDPDTVRAPDVAFVGQAKLVAGIPEKFAPFAPDLAVEVASPSNTSAGLHEKVLDYLDAGCRLVWVVEPKHRRVIVYRSRAEVRVLEADDTLDAGDVVPGFRIRVHRLFG